MPITNIKTILITAIASAIFLLVSFLLYSNYSLKRDLQHHKNMLIQAQIYNQSMSESVETQNASIDNYIKAAAENAKKHSIELAKAKDEARKLKSDAANILLISKPQNVSACDASLSLIKKEVLQNVK